MALLVADETGGKIVVQPQCLIWHVALYHCIFLSGDFTTKKIAEIPVHYVMLGEGGGDINIRSKIRKKRFAFKLAICWLLWRIFSFFVCCKTRGGGGGSDELFESLWDNLHIYASVFVLFAFKASLFSQNCLSELVKSVSVPNLLLYLNRRFSS